MPPLTNCDFRWDGHLIRAYLGNCWDHWIKHMKKEVVWNLQMSLLREKHRALQWQGSGLTAVPISILGRLTCDLGEYGGGQCLQIRGPSDYAHLNTVPLTCWGLSCLIWEIKFSYEIFINVSSSTRIWVFCSAPSSNPERGGGGGGDLQYPLMQLSAPNPMFGARFFQNNKSFPCFP